MDAAPAAALPKTAIPQKRGKSPMEMVREVVPLLIGGVLPPVLMLAMRPARSGILRFLIAFVPAIVLGACASFLNGELAGDLPEALFAVIVDTSLVYTGSQIAYHLIWKPLFNLRPSSDVALSGESTSRG
jgi:hypothetical protein